MRATEHSRGSVLILVIWCVLVLSLTILGAGKLVEHGISSQRLASRRFDAKQLALTGVAYGLNPKIEKDDPLLSEEIGTQLKLRVRIGTEGGKININGLLARPDDSELVDLFRVWGVSESEARMAVDCLKDWVDPGELRSLNGAERSDLIGTSYSQPENRPFLAVEEMRGVKGMDLVEEVKPDWMNSFSVLSGDRLDVQEADAELLEIFGKLTSAQTESILTYRNGLDQEFNTGDDIQIKSIEEISAIAGLSAAQLPWVNRNFQVGGSPIRIESVGLAGDTTYVISVIVPERKPTASYLWWEEK